MQNNILDELKKIAGWTDEDMKQITITGADPVVYTRFKVGETFAAVLAACGLAAAKLWELRTGRKQHITIDVEEAVAAMNSFMYCQVKEPPEGTEEEEMSEGTLQMLMAAMFTSSYQTRDGRWFYIHGGTTPQPLLDFFGCEGSIESVAEAVAKYNAQELEDAFHEHGFNGSIVRSHAEWLETEQGKVLGALPIVEINKIGDSAPVPLKEGERPLAGIRSLDLTRILAGPSAARTLAEHGADILWIGAGHLGDIPSFALDTGHGKRAAYLDLRAQYGKDRLWELASGADIFSHSYRTGSKMAQEFSPENLAKHRPGIIYTQINAFGLHGSWAPLPGFEQVAQAAVGVQLEEGKYEPAPYDEEAAELAGFLYATFLQPKGTPRLLCGAFCDYISGYLTAFGTMVAIYRRATEGGSYHVNTSLAQAGMSLFRMGLVDEETAFSQPFVLSKARVERMLTDEHGPLGHLSYFKPATHMSETEPYYELPTVTRGSSEPAWLD